MKRIYVWLTLICIVFGYCVTRYVQKGIVHILPSTTIFFFDKQWSQQLCSSVQTFVNQRYGHCQDPALVINDMLQRFPEVKSVSMELCDADKICFHVQSNQPICIVNDQVLYADGSISSVDSLDAQKVDSLLVIGSKTEWKSDARLLLYFALLVPISMYKFFDFEWVSDSCIILHKKEIPNFGIITWYKYFPSELYASKIIELYQLLYKPKKKKNNNKILFDVRFEKQLIVRTGG